MAARVPSSLPLDVPDGELVEPGVLRRFLYENVAVLAWYSAPTVSAIEEAYRLGLPLRQRYPRGGSIVHVLRGNRLTIMDAPARDAMVKAANDLGNYTAAVAAVLAVDGFLASAVRSVITGLRVRSKHDFEYRLHATSAEVISWLPQVNLVKTGVEIDPQRLLAVLQHAETSTGH